MFLSLLLFNVVAWSTVAIALTAISTLQTIFPQIGN